MNGWSNFYNMYGKRIRVSRDRFCPLCEKAKMSEWFVINADSQTASNCTGCSYWLLGEVGDTAWREQEMARVEREKRRRVRV